MSCRPSTRAMSRKCPENPSLQSPTIPFRSRKIRKITANSKSVNPISFTLTSNQEAPIQETLVSKNPNHSETLISKNPDQEQPLFIPLQIKPLSSDGEIECSIRHLRDSDPLLGAVIDAFQPPSFDSSKSPFLALTKSIIFQQLSTKAGRCIYTRFITLFGSEGEANVNFQTVLNLSAEKLREIGISGRKASYMHDLAGKYEGGILSDEMILEMGDEEMLERLTMVKGIGVWTVHMFMIFSLHRPDVLPVGDLGVRKGVRMLYELTALPDASVMERVCEKWKPYRSVAAWYMWRFVEAKGVLALAAPP